MSNWLHSATSSVLYNDLKDIFEFGSFLVSIIGIIAIFVSIKQLKSEQEKLLKEQKDKEKDVEYKQKEKSIEILEFFANDLIPQIDNYIEKSSDEFSEFGDLSNEEDEKKRMIILLVKKNCGIGNIFNQLEHVCLNICSGLADEEMLYHPLNKIIIDFVNENFSVYSDLLKVAPYKYLTQIYGRWTKMGELNELNKQSKEIESKKASVKNELEKNN